MHTLTDFWTSRCIIGEMVEENNGEVKMTPAPLVNFVVGKGLVVLGLMDKTKLVLCLYQILAHLECF